MEINKQKKFNCIFLEINMICFLKKLYEYDIARLIFFFFFWIKFTIYLFAFHFVFFFKKKKKYIYIYIYYLYSYKYHKELNDTATCKRRDLTETQTHSPQMQMHR